MYPELYTLTISKPENILLLSVNTMGFPPVGRCTDIQSHQIRIITNDSNKYIKHESCHKCDTEFNQIYFKGKLIKPHYYHCDQCPLLLCLNCARSANVHDENASNIADWNNLYLLSSSRDYMRQAPALNVNRLELNKMCESGDKYLLNRYLKSIIKLFGGSME